MQMDQVRSQDTGKGISRAAPQEHYYHAGLDRPAAAAGLSEADGVLVLMELLEEDDDEEEEYSTSPPPKDDDDADRLSRVIRSLEAEITRGGGDNGECSTRPPGGPGEIDGCAQLDDMLLDLDDGFGGAQAFGYCYWPEAPAAPVCVYSEGGEGSVVGYEMQVAREQQYYCADQCSVEQVYGSLWE